MNFFNKKSSSKKNLSYNYKGSSLPLPSSEEKQLIPPKTSSKPHIFSEYLSKFTTKISSFSAKTQETSNVLTNMKYFLVFFISGLLLIALSIPYLAFLVINPQKFAGLFTLGSIAILTSLAILKGPMSFFKSFMNRERGGFAMIYLISLIGTFWVAVIEKNYALVMVFSFVQVNF